MGLREIYASLSSVGLDNVHKQIFKDVSLKMKPGNRYDATQSIVPAINPDTLEKTYGRDSVEDVKAKYPDAFAALSKAAEFRNEELRKHKRVLYKKREQMRRVKTMNVTENRGLRKKYASSSDLDSVRAKIREEVYQTQKPGAKYTPYTVVPDLTLKTLARTYSRESIDEVVRQHPGEPDELLEYAAAQNEAVRERARAKDPRYVKNQVTGKWERHEIVDSRNSIDPKTGKVGNDQNKNPRCMKDPITGKWVVNREKDPHYEKNPLTGELEKKACYKRADANRSRLNSEKKRLANAQHAAVVDSSPNRKRKAAELRPVTAANSLPPETNELDPTDDFQLFLNAFLRPESNVQRFA